MHFYCCHVLYLENCYGFHIILLSTFSYRKFMLYQFVCNRYMNPKYRHACYGTEILSSVKYLGIIVSVRFVG